MGIGPLFGILVQERPPSQAGFWGADFITWLQVAGGLAALALLIWILAEALGSMGRPATPGVARTRPVALTFPVLVFAALALVVYVVGFFLYKIGSGPDEAAAETATQAAAI